MNAKLYEIFVKDFGFWMVVGFLGQFIFALRFIVQWIVSERRKESVIPLSFWYLSIIGSLMVLAYAVRQADPVFIIGYIFNCVIYFRNLYLIYTKKRTEQAGD